MAGRREFRRPPDHSLANSWQWFDFPDITFTDDGNCHFELEAEAIDMAVELDTYREFLAILSREIEKLRQQIDG